MKVIAKMEVAKLNEQPSMMEKVGVWPARVKEYVQDLQTEMRRVTWPSWKQVRATTIVVIVAVFAFAAYFWAIDTLIANAINKVFTTFAK
jgi:preprotein translocase subunit SecE